MLTKKDFESTASIIKQVPDIKNRVDLANKFGEGYAKINPRFNWDIWYKACNLTLERSEVA